MEEAVKLYIPHKTAKVKNGQPWITANIKKLMSMGARNAFGLISNTKNDSGGVTSLKVAGKLVTTGIDKATALNTQFQSVFSKQKPLTLQQSTEIIVMNNSLDNCKYSVLSTLDITINGVTKLLQNLKLHKATGPDNIIPLVMKGTDTTIVTALTFKKSLGTEEVARRSRSKTGELQMLHQYSKRYTVHNYQPVSLTAISSKIMEHIVLSCAKKEEKHTVFSSTWFPFIKIL